MNSFYDEGAFPDGSLALAARVADANPDYFLVPGTDSVFIHQDRVADAGSALSSNSFGRVYVAAAAIKGARKDVRESSRRAGSGPKSMDLEDTARQHFRATGVLVSPTTDAQTWEVPGTDGKRLDANKAKQLSLEVRENLGRIAL